MRERIVMIFGVCVLCGIMTTGCAGMMSGMMERKMFQHHQSRLNFEETYTALLDGFTAADEWEVLGEYDNQQRYGEKGDLPGYKVIQVCNKETAFRILDNDETKFMGGMIPLKVCVYEDSKGTVRFSMMNTEMMAKMFDDPAVRAGIERATAEMVRIVQAVTPDER